MNQNQNLILAIILTLGIIYGWNYFYEKPRLQNLAMQNNNYHQQICDVILPLLKDKEEKRWLEKATEKYV